MRITLLAGQKSGMTGRWSGRNDHKRDGECRTGVGGMRHEKRYDNNIYPVFSHKTRILPSDASHNQITTKTYQATSEEVIGGEIESR